MNVSQKMVQIVTASILLTALPGSALIYGYAQHNMLAHESTMLEKVTGESASWAMQRFVQGEPKLASLAYILEKELEKPINSGEIEVFHRIVEQNPDGVWRNRKTGYDGKREAGIFLPPNAYESDAQKVVHLRIKRIMDTFGSAASKSLENVWYLSPHRSEIIFDRTFPEFVFDQKADNDYTQTPWVTLTSPLLNPKREFRFTPPLFDPVPKVWMVSALYPLYLKGQWIGTLGEDMQLTSVLETMFSSHQLYHGTEHFLLDSQGNYILAGHWQKQLESSPETFHQHLSLAPQLAALLKSDLTDAPTTLNDEVMIQGKRYMAIGMRLEPLNWKYYRLVPVDEIMAPTRRLFYVLGGMILLVAGLTGLMIWTATGTSITRRIKLLSNVMKGYASDQHHRVSGRLGNDDEIAEVAHVFDKMADNIDLKVAEQKLAEDKLRTLLVAIEQSPTSIVITDLDANLQYVNPQFTHITGYTSEEVLGINPRMLQSGLTPKETYCAMWDTVRTGKVWSGELINRRKNGDIYFEEAHISPVVNELGEIIQYVGIKFDITDRKKIELALQESHQQINSLLNSMAEGAYGVDVNGICTFVNQSFLHIMGYDNSVEVIGKHIHELIHHSHPDGSHYPATECRMYAAYRHRENIHVSDEVFWRKDGTPVFVEYWSQPVFKNSVLTGAIATFIDITERRLSEHQLRIAATVFESQEGMMVTDANNIILRVNNAFTTITGYSAEEAVGQNPRLLSSGRQDKEFYTTMWKSINDSGVWDGEIWCRRKSGEIYPEYLTITVVKDAIGVITNYVATFTDITMNKAASDEIKSLAFYDPLTRLPNRRLLLDRLNQALVANARNGSHGALLFLDLDYFKTLNDTLGHSIGDLLLQQVAERLTSCVREGDAVARIGGDEFVVLLEHLSERLFDAAAQTEVIGNKILASLNQPYQLLSHRYRSTPSIGATLFHDHQFEVEDLLKQADIAMYQAKKAGRNTLRFFDPVMQETINARANMERDLRKAIDDKEFQLYYQVQVDHLSHPLGAEALIRWHHPELGLVPPFNFIALAEETGLILPIGLWVLETACAQLKTWEQDTLTRDLSISVNVSPKQFNQADFVTQIQTVVRRHAINPILLKLELTESMLVDNIENIIITMVALQAIGVRFELDDFGTGYSSLQYLKQLPLYQLKIDQSFVRDIATDGSDQAIVRTIIAMAQSLNLEVIAEGVETKEQQQLLLNSGCRHYQGYLFGRPVPIEQFEEALRQGDCLEVSIDK
ncbi:MAG: EAL domain-containing protein [Methylotenera sp.]|nr:EAL domain-containing protein [Methylotenera sp.]